MSAVEECSTEGGEGGRDIFHVYGGPPFFFIFCLDFLVCVF